MDAFLTAFQGKDFKQIIAETCRLPTPPNNPGMPSNDGAASSSSLAAHQAQLNAFWKAPAATSGSARPKSPEPPRPWRIRQAAEAKARSRSPPAAPARPPVQHQAAAHPPKAAAPPPFKAPPQAAAPPAQPKAAQQPSSSSSSSSTRASDAVAEALELYRKSEKAIRDASHTYGCQPETDPAYKNAEQLTATKYNIKRRDRGPKDDESIFRWRNQLWREGSKRFANRGGRSREYFAQKYGRKPDQQQ